MERCHGHDWACMVEPIKKFVQCFGVSKRPDSYLRVSCGPDRIRLWRLSDFEKHSKELDLKCEQIEELKLQNEKAMTQLIADHSRREAELNVEKQDLMK